MKLHQDSFSDGSSAVREEEWEAVYRAHERYEWLRLDGDFGRFTSLMSWNSLAWITSSATVRYPRMKLVLDGCAIDPSRYSRARERREEPILDFTAIQDALSGGATLVIDAVDELSSSLNQLAAHVTSIFSGRVGINLYASFGTSAGFKTHWDNHDTLILQLHGRKHWKILPPTMSYPLKGTHPMPEVPDDRVAVWEGNLEAGSILYLPRGFWHLVTAVDEPSMHVTIGIQHESGYGLIKWLLQNRDLGESFRRDIPLDCDPAEALQYLHQLRGELAKNLTLSLLTDYGAHLNATARSRSVLRLPPAPISAGDLTTEMRFSLSSRRPFSLHDNESTGQISLSSCYKTIKFDKSACSYLRCMSTLKSFRLNQLMEDADNLPERTRVAELLAFLVNNGILTIVESALGPPQSDT